MNTYKDDAFFPIDEEEKDLVSSLEDNEWQPVKDADNEREKLIRAAANTLSKNKRINMYKEPYYKIG